MFRRIKISSLVKHMRSFRQHTKSMRETHGNPQHALVLSGKPHGLPLAKSFRTPAHVNRHIQNLSDGYPHQLSLGMRHLIVQPSQHVAGGAGMIVLHECFSNSSIRHHLPVVALKEKAALIAEYLRLENENSRQGS